MSTCHGPGVTEPLLDTQAQTTSTRTTSTRTTVLLVGNPNVGKSTLFNGMTGRRQRVMNAPGTTVQLQVGTWRTPGGAIEVVDLPGTYSLVARSPDEQVVADVVVPTAAGPGAVVVVVLDANALARSLYLLAQVLGTGRPVVAVVSMLDVARQHGSPLDEDRLAALLGIPVLGVDPRRTDDLPKLADAVAAQAASTQAASTQAASTQALLAPPARPTPSATDGHTPDPDFHLAQADELFAWVEGVVASLAPPTPSRVTRTDRVDRALLNPWLGIPVFLAVMWSLFELTTSVAAPVMDLAARWVTGPAAAAVRWALPAWSGEWVEGLLVDGVLAGVGTVFAFLPLMAIVYTALALLEDSGYMARAAFVADRAMRAIGLDGRAMLPLIIGFGCNVPALGATRTLPDARQRLLTGLLVPWTTCAARLTVYVLIAGAFFGDHAGTAIFAMYVLSLVLVVGGGFVLRRTLFRDVRREPLLLVLPAYQRPRLGPILASVGHRVGAFATKAGRLIIVTLTLVWVLMSVPAAPGHDPGDVPVEASLYGRVATATAPVFAPAGLDDWHVTAALATGFVAKEVVVGSLVQSYAVAGGDGTAQEQQLSSRLRATLHETSGGHGGAAALALMVFVLGYTPCVATLAEQRRLFGLRWTSGAVVVQLVTAWLLAVAVFQVGRLW